VLSRYFARQIVDILDATDPGDREIREREMRGLEQFFGMGIADKAQVGGGASAAGGAPGMLGQVKAKLGLGTEGQSETPALGGFPTTGAAVPMAPPRMPSQGAQGAKPAASSAKADGSGSHASNSPGPTRDWSKMIARVKDDVERICDFLEALAKHPRGLQKYHEEAVRTVHDSWIDREGEQSLRRWVRSECARIWPHKFAAIEAEKDRARADIDALEELFGPPARAAAAPSPVAAASAVNGG
jgi:hypothetical protein